ncbi:hypothetical protein ABT369_44950 [Dactylosporangium sp. NPDC000244]|uniref:hypothetical protein n=1 Tax=Dactylosporangium sp. NPDC000244 TaxID=3154365 RepID=UPI003326EE36
MSYRWEIWTDGPSRLSTAAEGAGRLLETMRALAAVFPGEADTVRMTAGGGQLPVADDATAEGLREALAASGNTGVEVLGLGRGRLWITWRDPDPGRAGARAELRIGTKPLMNPALEERLPGVAALVAEAGRIWAADYAWIDLVHVRQDWNHWRRGLPVFSLATWLRDTAARVDTAGLDVDTTDVGGGRLVTLRVPPAAVGNDEDGAVSGGRALVRALAARTVLADGRRLLEANPALAD